MLLDSICAILVESEKVREIRRMCSHVKFVVVCMEEDAETFVRAVQLGVTGYVLKEASALEVTAAVRASAARHRARRDCAATSSNSSRVIRMKLPRIE